MSVNFYSYSVIGVEIDEDDLYQPAKMVKAFEHNHGRDVKFCPQTGKECWKEVREPISEWDEYQTLGEYKVHHSTDQRRYVVGIVASETGSSDGGDDVAFNKLPHNIEGEKERLKSFLKPLGLWNDRKFGLYAILYCSY